METLWFKDKTLFLIDQRKLPLTYEVFEARDYEDVFTAIKEMVVRGAPAIGVTAAYGYALAALNFASLDKSSFTAEMHKASTRLAESRPTAVNLFWALEHQKRIMEDNIALEPAEIAQILLNEAHKLKQEDIAANMQMGANGAALFDKPLNFLTHCNAGALATAGYGTALGVIRAAHKKGLVKMVYVDETRPYLQGARLTAWELFSDKIPLTLITDNMAGFFFKQGAIDAVVVGADRIAANGDTANKIGTYTVSVLAKEHNVPFYVAAPLSTIDRTKSSGSEIPIEERSKSEITHVYGKRVIPEEIPTRNPAFDVTPAGNITAIITEKGVAIAPFVQSINSLFEK